MLKVTKYLLSFSLAFSLAGCSASGSSAKSDSQVKNNENTSVSESTGIKLGKDIAVVSTEKGKLRGYLDNGIYTYHGIPYATAERYQEPQEVESWDYIRDAQVYGVMSPQSDMTTGQSEVMTVHNFWPEATAETENQIQTLNVWTNEINNESAKKPVMVWIHGGGYMSGASTEQVAYDGRNLAEFGDVVVVSVNHRLNSLGYLDLSAYGDAYKNSGNLGMLDLIAALQWVNDNITAFGGDPDNVTIFGQSGGGGKVLNLYSMPAAQDLFDKAIVMSGGSGDLFQTNCLEPEITQKVAALTIEKLGLTAETIDEIKTVDYDLLKAANDAALSEVGNETGKRVTYQPVHDGVNIVDNVWLDQDLGEIAKDKPLMIGYVFAEFTTNASGTFDSGNGAVFKNELDETAVAEMLESKYGENYKEVLDAFHEAFPGKPDVDLYYYAANFLSGNRDADTKVKQAGANVYTYLFYYEFDTMGGWLPWHCAEIPFVFHNTDKAEITVGNSAAVKSVENDVASSWVSFAKNGDPNHEGMIEWPAYTGEETGQTFVFDTKPYVVDQSKLFHLIDLTYSARGAKWPY